MFVPKNFFALTRKIGGGDFGKRVVSIIFCGRTFYLTKKRDCNLKSRRNVVRCGPPG
jgi:hypothetical protein